MRKLLERETELKVLAEAVVALGGYNRKDLAGIIGVNYSVLRKMLDPTGYGAGERLRPGPARLELLAELCRAYAMSLEELAGILKEVAKESPPIGTYGGRRSPSLDNLPELE